MKLSNKTAKELFEYLYNEGSTPALVYESFMEDMPYGTAKARTGDPDNWLADHFDTVIDRMERLYSEDLQNHLASLGEIGAQKYKDRIKYGDS